MVLKLLRGKKTGRKQDFLKINNFEDLRQKIKDHLNDLKLHIFLIHIQFFAFYSDHTSWLAH